MMMMLMNLSAIITIIFLFQSIKQISAIQCYTCNELDFNCPLPLNLDGGDESNENDIDTAIYDAGFACMSDHWRNPQTGKENIILRGINHCEEINIPNRRVHCCYTNNCNKQLPPMTIKTYADMINEGIDIESNGHEHLSSMILVILVILLQYFY